MTRTPDSDPSSRPDRDPGQERVIEEKRAAQKQADAASEEMDASIRKSIKDHGA